MNKTLLTTFLTLLFLLLPSVFSAEQLGTRTFYTVEGNDTCTIVTVANLEEPRSQNITLTVKTIPSGGTCTIGDANGALSNANITANITLPNGTLETLFFSNFGNGNYSLNFSFSNNGTYALRVAANRTPDTTTTTTRNIDVGHVVRSLSVSPSTATTAETVTFTINLTNTGDAALLNVSPFLQVFFSNGTLAENISVASGLQLNSSVPSALVTYQRVFSNFTAGIYSFNVLVLYNTSLTPALEGVFSNISLNLTLTAPGGGGQQGGGGGGGGGISGPTTPQAGPLVFVKTPVLRETYPGSELVIDFAAFNPTTQQHDVAFSVTGISVSWLNLFNPSFTLKAGAQQTSAFSIHVPKDATPGDYVLTVKTTASGAIQSNFLVLRVKQPLIPTASSYRSVDLNFKDNKTLVKLDIVNNDGVLRALQVFERVSSKLGAGINQIEFQTQPDDILKAEPVELLFTFSNLVPYEKREIAYTINKLATQYEPIVYWPLGTATLVPEAPIADKILVYKLYWETMTPGSRVKFITGLENEYRGPITTTVKILLPTNWKANTEQKTVTLNAQSRQEIAFEISVPGDAQYGTYNAQLLISYEGAVLKKDLLFRVAPTAVGGLAVGFFGLLGEDRLALALAIIIAFFVARHVYRAKYGVGPRYPLSGATAPIVSKDRLETLLDIKEQIKRKP